MTTTTRPIYDSPENLRSRRQGLEALPPPAQERVGVLVRAFRLALYLPSEIPQTDTKEPTFDSGEIQTTTIKTDKLTETDKQIEVSKNRSALEQAREAVNTVWSNN